MQESSKKSIQFANCNELNDVCKVAQQAVVSWQLAVVSWQLAVAGWWTGLR